MVHVYSVSSSSLTVQLYSRSRFLTLLLMNRLNIFLSRARLQDQNNTQHRSMQVNVTLTAFSGSPRTASSHGFSRRGVHHRCPDKFPLAVAPCWAQEDPRMPASRDPEAGRRRCVCVDWGVISCDLSPFTAAASARWAGLGEDWRRNEPTGARGAVRVSLGLFPNRRSGF